MLNPHPSVNVRRRKRAARRHVILTSGSRSSEAEIQQSAHIASNLLETRGFLRVKRKVVVFRNLASNIVILC
jgi:hypothetical protein